MKLVMAIPTYWTGEGGCQAGDTIFDHPTSLAEEGTLGRALKSLSRLDRRDFQLVVVVTSTSPDLRAQTRAKVSRIIREARPAVETFLFTHAGLDQLHQFLLREGWEHLTRLLSLDGYSHIRNGCAVAAQLLGADALVQIDDDEVIHDSSFVSKIHEDIAAGVQGLAGYYCDSHGSYFLPGPRTDWETHWGKPQAMNEAFREIIGSPPRLTPTPFAFGGNMTLTRDLFSTIPFDPRITRGEDIDYLINAKLNGVSFLLDNTLAITHLPPPHSHPWWQQLRQDAIRFTYERDKLQGAGADPADFDPYPGPFLRPDLPVKLARVCCQLAEEYQRRGDPRAAARSLAIVDEAESLTSLEAWSGYCSFQWRWQELMSLLADQNADQNWVDRVLSRCE